MYVNFKVTDKKSLGRKPDMKILVKNLKKKPFSPFKKKFFWKIDLDKQILVYFFNIELMPHFYSFCFYIIYYGHVKTPFRKGFRYYLLLMNNIINQK